MAFYPKKIDLNEINNGNEYVEADIVSPEDFNDLFRSIAYSQTFIDVFGNNMDTRDVANTGVPKVELVTERDSYGNEYKFLKFSNLKGDRGADGKRGDSGLTSGAALSNYYGESDIDGYTKSAVNTLVSNPNILINGDFRINQRGLVTYERVAGYTLDRWRTYGGVNVTKTANGIIVQKVITTQFYSEIIQVIPNTENIGGKKVTLSAMIDGEIYKKTYTASSDPSISPADLPVEGFGTIGLRYSSARGFFFVGIYLTDNYDPEMKPHEISWVKLEYGEVATSHTPRPYEQELALCQRYYQKRGANSLPIEPLSVIGTSKFLTLSLTTPMRTTPTISGYENIKYVNSSSKPIAQTSCALSGGISSTGVANNDVSMVTYQLEIAESLSHGVHPLVLVGEIEFNAEIM